MRPFAVVLLLFCTGCATVQTATSVAPSQSKRGPADPIAAMRYHGIDPQKEFQSRLAKGLIPFLGIREHGFQDQGWIPGLTKAEIHEYITLRHQPFEFYCDNMDFLVTDGLFPSVPSYVDAVHAFLTAYNHLVLAELKRRDSSPAKH